MSIGDRVTDWLETHWVNPSYGGWLLAGLTIFFFAAATNTLAGWLYVISGVSCALLILTAVISARSLRQVQVTRSAITPVSVGEQLTIELAIANHHPTQAKALLEVQDLLPYVLGKPAKVAIESVPAQGEHQWTYYHPTERRGVYRWQTVQLRTAFPLGLFWCRRNQAVKATAVVYPMVLPLTQCPLLDEMGQESNLQLLSQQRSQNANEDMTRSLRPYRWGDPTRLVHWRTSARYGELRVRELEVFTGGNEVFICLDSAGMWQADNFEQAVTTAASLYSYARNQQVNVKLWTAGTGLLHGDWVILEALAAVHAGEEAIADAFAKGFLTSTAASQEIPLIWLTENSVSLEALPPGSRWLLWSAPANGSIASLHADSQAKVLNRSPGLIIDPAQPLQPQLQAPVTR